MQMKITDRAMVNKYPSKLLSDFLMFLIRIIINSGALRKDVTTAIIHPILLFKSKAMPENKVRMDDSSE
jgi:hypothetical protein